MQRAYASTGSTSQSRKGTFYGYDMDNLYPFKNFLENKGYDFNNPDDILEMGENFFDFYYEALEEEIIVQLDNDMLFMGVPKVTPYLALRFNG